MEDQQLILVNDQDVFSGKYAPKKLCHTGKGLHHRAFTLLIYNSRGEILLQDRKHQLWDHYWDLTNSHPLHKKDGSDESYQEAIGRCLRREWGIGLPVRKIFGFNYQAKHKNYSENEYCLFFIGEHNDEVFPNSKAAYGYKWVPFKNFLADIQINSRLYTPWLLRAIAELQKRQLLEKLPFFLKK